MQDLRSTALVSAARDPVGGIEREAERVRRLDHALASSFCLLARKEVMLPS